MFTLREILDATGGRLIAGRLNNRVSGVSIDSRSIKPRELFIAIKGQRFDGHSFIEQARRKRAGAILFANPLFFGSSHKYSNPIPMVKVKDTLQALGDLAHYHRARFKIPLIAVTGSNGKTTTKEMTSHILSKKFNLLRNPGTQNNLIGVPLAIFDLRNRHDLAVIEIGASKPGEIARLSWIIQPNVAILTNIGPSHLEFFKSLKGVLKAKLEVMRNLSKGSKLIVNQDDRLLSGLCGANLPIITFGQSPSSDFYGEKVTLTNKRTSFLLNRRHRIVLKTLGRHNVYNALASIACARDFGVAFDEIKDALYSFVLPPMRMQMLKVNGIKIINDCYNANPESLRYALDFLKEVQSEGKKIVVCGDMLELGRQAPNLHKDIGKRIAKNKVDFLITVGPLSRNIASGAMLTGMSRNSVYSCRNCIQVAQSLHALASAGDVILVKGSRAMKMENVVECFINYSIH